MQHRHTRKSAVRLAGAALTAALSLGLAAAASADQLQDILAAKKLRVAIDLGVPPYGMKDAALKSTGSDVETARLLAQDLGVELEIVPTTGANRVPFLQTNKADIVISSMSITPERQKVVDFSVPYAAILAVVGAPRSMTLTSAADLANKKVIATRGTTNDAELTKIAPKDAQIIRFDDDATSITAVVSGQADIFATAPALLRTINDKAPAKQMESKFVMRLNMLGIGLRKNEPALKARLDGWVRDNLQNGKLNAVYKEFHGVNLPPEVQGPAAERPEATMARIASVDIFLVDLLPKVVRTDAVQSFERQETPIVRITDSDGAVGVGYSYTIGTGGSAVARLLDEHLAPMLPGREAGDVEGLWRELMYRVHATTVGALTSIALAAIDTALWDLRARRAGLPLHRLAGGAATSRSTPPRAAGCTCRPRRWSRARCRPGGRLSWRQAQGRAAPCGRGRGAHRRRARGRGRRLGHHGGRQPGLSVPEAIRRARAFEPLDIAWLEEPIHADDVHAHRRLSASTTVPIAVGESLYSLSQFKDYLQSDACSVVQVDVGRIGGITPWLKVAHMAEAYNVPVCPHFLMEIHVALCCAVPNNRWLEYIPQLDLITQSGMRIEDGHGVPSQAPGLGIDWDWAGIERLARHRSRHG